MITFCMLLISLQSMYFHSIGAPLYAVAGTAFLFFYACFFGEFKIDGRMALSVFGPIVLLLLALVAFFIRLGGSFENPDVSLGRCLGFLVILLVPVSVAMLGRKIDVNDILFKLLWIHVSVFFVQFILYFGFKVDFDPVFMLSDVQQRGWGGALQHLVLGGFRRLGGLYSEPGTYATYVGPMIALLFASGPKDGKYKVVIFAGLVSMLLSFSIFAWLFVSIIAFAMLITSFRRFLLLLSIFPAFLFLALPYIEYRFSDPTGSGIDGGLGFRLEILNSLLGFSTENLGNFLFGVGLLSIRPPFEFSGALNDVGLVAYLQMNAGFLGMAYICFIILCISSRNGPVGLTLAAILLISKISLFSPMFWLILALASKLESPKKKRFQSSFPIQPARYEQ
jgi:hypothetical protein